MAGDTQIAKATVLIDGKEAAYELEVLKKKTKELKTEMDKAFKSGDKELWKKLKGDSDELESSMKKVRATTVDVTAVLKNLNGTSLKNLNAAQKQITAELTKMERGTKEYVAASGSLQKVEAEIRKVKTEMHGATTDSGKLGLSFKNLFGSFTAAALAVKAIGAITSALKQLWSGSIEAAEESQKSNKLLSSVLKGRESEYQRLILLAEELQLVTGIDDETIKAQETFLVLQGRTEEQIKKMIQTALDMAAAVPDMSFETALKQLDGTMEGTIGKMGKLDDRLKKLTPEELAAGKAVEILGEKYKGTAVNAATLSDKLKVAGDELKEALGDSAIINNFRKAWLDLTQTVTDFIKVPVSEKMQDEKEKVNALVGVLKDNNTQQGVRKAAYDELVKIAPKVVDGIDSENISIIKLNQNLDAYNKNMIVRITLQANEEKITDANKDASKALQTQLKKQTDLTKEINELEGELFAKGKRADVMAYYNEYTRGKLTIQEYSTAIATLAVNNGLLTKAQRTQAGNLSGTYDELINRINTVTAAESDYNKSLKESEEVSKDILAQRDLLIKTYGADFINSIENTNIVTKENTEKEKENKEGKEQLKDAYEKLNEELSKYSKLAKSAFANDDIEAAKLYSAEVARIGEEIETINELFKKWTNPLAGNTDIETIDEETTEKQLQDYWDTRDEIFEDQEKQDIAYKAAELEREKALGEEKKKIAEEVARAKTELEQKFSDTVIELTNIAINKKFDNEIHALDVAKDNELANKNLTEAQKEIIEQKYAAENLRLRQQRAKDEKLISIGKITADTALAVMKTIAQLGGIGAITPPGIALIAAMTAMGLMQASVVAAQPIPQYAKGKYPVKGASDGKTYNAGVSTDTSTRLLTSPTILAGEQMPEWIIDGPTTKKMMNYPELTNAILMLSGRVPQYAVGKSPAQNNTSTNNDSITFTDPRMIDAIEKFNKHIENGIVAKVIYSQFEKVQDKVNETRTRFNA